ncbi:GFA family protein [Paracoccus sp. S-4012]|uniref:GFA family protein n=1 Tax=Paracoccus sp. S-4012 TaxID=2665648 RepID=UPI0012B0A8C4|nr:GFA family protein [Paracoccus sp. S-4012]MRX50620.1 GFA family protein [Paracoccus sp. S-4012]
MTTRHYTGSCQCGAISFEVDADLDNTVTCNCSRCRRLGSVLTFVPADAVTFLRDGSTEYRFNRKVIGHHFCPVCGIQTHGLGEMDGKPIVAVNVNCLEGVNARELPSRAMDGASL